MEELITTTKTVLEGCKQTNKVFSHPLSFNPIPFIDKLQPNGYSREEMKVALETRKIFGLEEGDVRISCTAVRVPVTRVHSEAITIETHSPIDPERARAVLRSATGVEIIDDPADNVYPMPISATGKQAVEVKHVKQTLAIVLIVRNLILLCC
jgi:aspartate-semialdehyde dehydrogenase